MFWPFSASSGRHSTKENTLMASYKHICAKRRLKYRILKWLKIQKSAYRMYTVMVIT